MISCSSRLSSTCVCIPQRGCYSVSPDSSKASSGLGFCFLMCGCAFILIQLWLVDSTVVIGALPNTLVCDWLVCGTTSGVDSVFCFGLLQNWCPKVVEMQTIVVFI